MFKNYETSVHSIGNILYISHLTVWKRNIWIAEYAKGIEYTIFDPYKRLYPVRTPISRNSQRNKRPVTWRAKKVYNLLVLVSQKLVPRRCTKFMKFLDTESMIHRRMSMRKWIWCPKSGFPELLGFVWGQDNVSINECFNMKRTYR